MMKEKSDHRPSKAHEIRGQNRLFTAEENWPRVWYDNAIRVVNTSIERNTYILSTVIIEGAWTKN